MRSTYQYNENVKSNEPPGFQLTDPISISTFMVVSAYAITIYVVGQTFREFVQIYQQKWQYLNNLTNNLISWMLYISSTIMVSSVFNGGWVTDVHFSATSITVFLSWFNLLLFLQRFDQVSQNSNLVILLFTYYYCIINLFHETYFGNVFNC